jgi:type I restriction enzyme, R subunit
LIENTIEELVIELLNEQGFEHIHAPEIAHDGDRPERRSYEDVLLLGRLKAAVRRINPSVPIEAQEEAIKEIERLHSPELLTNNEDFHRMLTEGVKVSFQKDGIQRGGLVWLVDFEEPGDNDFVVANQFTVIEN